MSRRRTVLALALALVGAASAQRTFTVRNDCPFTVWPAIFTDPGKNTEFPAIDTGWEAAPFSLRTFTVPHKWTAGRIWGRRDCNFSGPPANAADTQCLTGGCAGGGLLCQAAGGVGVPPATLAEWTLDDPASGNDFYDVSLVDGYNLPMSVSTNTGCPVAGCFVDLGPQCPDQLKGPFDATGFPVGCKTACLANLDGTPDNSANCCSGSHSTPATCPNSGVQFYSYFKNACPNAYAYAFDESSGTALWTCQSTFQAQYTVTFCPAQSENFSTPGTASSTPAASGSASQPSGTQPSTTGSASVTGTETGIDSTALPAAVTEPPAPFVNPNEGLGGGASSVRSSGSGCASVMLVLAMVGGWVMKCMLAPC